MSKTMEMPVAPEKTRSAMPVAESPKSMCVEFVEFCKEQHLEARSAQVMLHALHNHKWKAERDQIRDAMRPEIDALFAPIERALAEGKDCQGLMKTVMKAVRDNK